MKCQTCQAELNTHGRCPDCEKSKKISEFCYVLAHWELRFASWTWEPTCSYRTLEKAKDQRLELIERYGADPTTIKIVKITEEEVE